MCIFLIRNKVYFWSPLSCCNIFKRMRLYHPSLLFRMLYFVFVFFFFEKKKKAKEGPKKKEKDGVGDEKRRNEKGFCTELLLRRSPFFIVVFDCLFVCFFLPGSRRINVST